MKMKYRFMMNPTEEEKKKLLRTFEHCCFVYNKLLDVLRIKKTISEISSKDVTRLKRRYKELKNMHCTLLYAQISHLFRSWKEAGEKVESMRPKKLEDFTMLPFYKGGYQFLQKKRGDDVFLVLHKIGRIPVDVDRDIEGQVKKVVVERDGSDDWYVSVSTEPFFSIIAKRN